MREGLALLSLSTHSLYMRSSPTNNNKQQNTTTNGYFRGTRPKDREQRKQFFGEDISRQLLFWLGTRYEGTKVVDERSDSLLIFFTFGMRDEAGAEYLHCLQVSIRRISHHLYSTQSWVSILHPFPLHPLTLINTENYSQQEHWFIKTKWKRPYVMVMTLFS